MLSPELTTFVQKILQTEKPIHLENINDLLNYEVEPGKFKNVFKSMCCGNHPTQVGRLKLIKECLDLGIDVNQFDSKRSPLIYHVVRDQPDIALFLLENGVYSQRLKDYFESEGSRNLIVETAYYPAPQYFIEDKIKILDFLYEKGHFNPNKATRFGHHLLEVINVPQIAQWFLDKGLKSFNVKYGMNDFIEHHIKKDQPEMVHLLKKYGAEQECLQIIQKINLKVSQKDNGMKFIASAQPVRKGMVL